VTALLAHIATSTQMHLFIILLNRHAYANPTYMRLSSKVPSGKIGQTCLIVTK
jgi:hypothetical protein